VKWKTTITIPSIDTTNLPSSEFAKQVADQLDNLRRKDDPLCQALVQAFRFIEESTDDLPERNVWLVLHVHIGTLMDWANRIVTNDPPTKLCWVEITKD